jgi:hypothetical protein
VGARSIVSSGGTMTAVRYVSAIICFGLGVTLTFAAVQSMYTSLGLGDNPGAAITAGVGAMFLLGTYLLLRRNDRASNSRAMRRQPNAELRPREQPPDFRNR